MFMRILALIAVILSCLLTIMIIIGFMSNLPGWYGEAFFINFALFIMMIIVMLIVDKIKETR
jgi:hypothetical protein